jgi:hypothetical protein
MGATSDEALDIVPRTGPEVVGGHQQLQQWSGTRREAHRRTTLAALHRCWAPQRETCRPLCAEAALEMAAAQAGLSVAARLYGLY